MLFFLLNSEHDKRGEKKQDKLNEMRRKKDTCYAMPGGWWYRLRLDGMEVDMAAMLAYIGKLFCYFPAFLEWNLFCISERDFCS